MNSSDIHSQTPLVPRVVLKFGGTSMGSFTAMQRSAEIVLGYAALPQHPQVPLPPVLSATKPQAVVLAGKMQLAVVVSAVAGVTNWLHQLFDGIRPESTEKLGLKLDPLRHKHEKIVENCALHFGLKASIIEIFYRSELDDLFAELEALVSNRLRRLQGLSQAQMSQLEQNKSCDSDLDQCLARCLAIGEKLSSQIFAFVLGQNIAKLAVGFPAEGCVRPVTVMGEELIASDSCYLKAKLDFGRSKLQIASKLGHLWEQGLLPVITGFIAADKEGRTTLLGRGGSDFSAAIIAAALKLPTLDIWTDVAGIYSSDPRLVQKARLWPSLDFSLVSEMAYSGAKVVHPKSISIALQNEVAVIVRSTFASQKKGTLISSPSAATKANGASRAKLARLVLSHDSLLLHMNNPNMLEGEGYIAQIAEAAHRQEIPIDVCATSETSFSFSIHHADCKQQLLDDLCQIGEISAIRHLHKLCCVGHKIGSDIGFIVELLLQCQQHGIQVQTISIGASHCNVTILFSLGLDTSETYPLGLSKSGDLQELGIGTGIDKWPQTHSEDERAAATELLRRLHKHFLEDE